MAASSGSSKASKRSRPWSKEWSPRIIRGRRNAGGRKSSTSPRQQAQEQLRLSRRKQEAILDTIPDPAWLKDREGRYLAVNAAWRRFMRLEADQAMGRTASDLFPRACRRNSTNRISKSCAPARRCIMTKS